MCKTADVLKSNGIIYASFIYGSMQVNEKLFIDFVDFIDDNNQDNQVLIIGQYIWYAEIYAIERPEERKKKYLYNWAMIPLTRAIDTLVITLRNP